MDNRQKTIGNGQKTIGNRQKTIGNGQLPVEVCHTYVNIAGEVWHTLQFLFAAIRIISKFAATFSKGECVLL